jgi:SIR2-like domain
VQFIPHGPDIPETLLQAHEEGRVVFFCGAGISYPAGLPGFAGLVDAIYQRNGTNPTQIEQRSLDLGNFDATLDLLERRLPGQRLAIRRALAEALKPNLRQRGATQTHEALLRLARQRDQTLRLVTTNFDRVFHAASRRSGLPFHEYAAPMLPIPKMSRWNGVVFLHGLLPHKSGDTALQRLVVTSGDFGLAYLTERWAARFVTELFRNYVVCFIGYSINDPVLRYMMDALAADRMQGESVLQAWAFGDCVTGTEHETKVEWQAKGVTPILYQRPAGTHDHSALHTTLKMWAETHRDGVLGKERIIVNHALAHPAGSTQQDDYVSRVLWALADKSGLPAKRFASFNPVPTLDWLFEAFCDDRFQHSDLSRFGVAPQREVDDKLRFSLIRRPAPYALASPMFLASMQAAGCQWDDVMHHLACWLLRHLDDPKLVIWIAQRGGRMHERLVALVEIELDRIAQLEREGRAADLETIRSHAPRAIPRPLMRRLWRLILSGRVQNAHSGLELHRWKKRWERDGMTASLRLQLKEFLTPRIEVRQPIGRGALGAGGNEPLRLSDLASCDVVLTAADARSLLPRREQEAWVADLPRILDDVAQNLKDALDLQHELGVADEWSDRSNWHLPSIARHWQNRGFREWILLIELLRDSWVETRVMDAPKATRIAQGWFAVPYPTFKRLALFAASYDECIEPAQWVIWLLSDGARWLWSSETMREVCRLLVLQGRHLNGRSREQLESAIASGPNRDMYTAEMSLPAWEELSARRTWLRLSKLMEAGVELSETATTRLKAISELYPLWTLSPNQRDEFSHWSSGTGDPDFEDSRDIDVAPRTRDELIVWLQQPIPERRPFYEDTWPTVCREVFDEAFGALSDLAQRNVWPAWRWQEALNVWSDEEQIERSWRAAAPILEGMPTDVAKQIVSALSYWLEQASRSLDEHERICIDLCHTILKLPLDERATISGPNGQPLNQPVTEAINHPVGRATQALIHLWFNRGPSDNEKLPEDLASLLTALCDQQEARFRHGRVILAAQLIAFFRADREWTERHLLPRFDWQESGEAASCWEGFLWSPRLFAPLMLAFKSAFLETAKHYTQLGEHRSQFAAFLTYAALDPIPGISTTEQRDAFASLPIDGLEEAAEALVQALQGAAEQREEYWTNRVLPFWRNVWPKSTDKISPRISKSLAELSITADSQFPVALDAVADWLGQIEYGDFMVVSLHESGLCPRFPLPALRLLDKLVTTPQWVPDELGKCLDEIANAQPQLVRAAEFTRLREITRRRDQ